MKMNAKHVLPLYALLKPEIVRAVKELAHERDCSIRIVIEEALSAYVKKYKGKMYERDEEKG